MPPEPAEECYAFAGFLLYPQQRTLLHQTQLVTIGGRAFDVLLMLVSHAGTVISAQELMDFVWPSVTVEEANLRVQMGMLRKILSQCEEAQRAIETIPLRGYCFILPVRHQQGEEARGPFMLAAGAALPMLLAPIVGRDKALELIAAALEARRLVTISGPGGIGKTTLAIAAAQRFAARHDRLTGFIDLSAARSGQDVLCAIAAALGLGPDGASLPVLLALLKECEMLLVLDTCEHIVEELALLVESLIAQCPRLTLLATSREALRVTGEWCHRLPSLAFPEPDESVSEGNIEDFPAIALFVDSVRASMHFSLQGRDLQLIAEICRRLDGIPLALEFAAARVADLGLHEILARLDDCFAILTRGRRTALPRHRTFSAALDWSYSLLSDAEQKALRHLASLPGAFTTGDALALYTGPEEQSLPEVLSSLYEKSLICVDFLSNAPFYRLFGTTRAYMIANRPA